MNRSENDEDWLRKSLEIYTARTVPALGIDAYAEKVYEVNKAAGR